ncbi:MAG: HAMP domain-containing histidine kinase [Polyangiaceae bacterium]|nr:HAMP domain-containing histidine kinase [Polyangiaceae bacterium]
MESDDSAAADERAKTDESLRIEREKADRVAVELARAQAEADALLVQAREEADADIEAARAEADRKLTAQRGSVAPHAVVHGERALEDRALEDERRTADESIRREREENVRMLAKLLPLERDRTDRHLLTERERADDAIASRDDFLGIVSHDLRNLLGAILMSADLLGNAPPDGAGDARAVAERIRRYGARMNRLIGDLVDVSSIDAGKLAMLPTRGDLWAVAVEAQEMFRAAAEAKGIELSLEAPPGPLEASFDHERALQVLANLLANAVKFTDKGGRIWIRGRREGRSVELSVGDTGAGIPANLLDAVFERFWQVGKQDRRGLGLGLYISKCIVEAHGGRIWAERNPDRGTTLVFTIPDV